MDFTIHNIKGNVIPGPTIEFSPTFQQFLNDNLISYKYSTNAAFGDSVIFNNHSNIKMIYCDLIELKTLSEEEIKNYLIEHFELDGD